MKQKRFKRNCLICGKEFINKASEPNNWTCHRKHIARGAVLDTETKKKLEQLKSKPKNCRYCKGKYYPHRNATAKDWEEQKYCRSICKANDNAKTPEPIL